LSIFAKIDELKLLGQLFNRDNLSHDLSANFCFAFELCFEFAISYFELCFLGFAMNNEL